MLEELDCSGTNWYTWGRTGYERWSSLGEKRLGNNFGYYWMLHEGDRSVAVSEITQKVDDGGRMTAWIDGFHSNVAGAIISNYLVRFELYVRGVFYVSWVLGKDCPDSKQVIPQTRQLVLVLFSFWAWPIFTLYSSSLNSSVQIHFRLEVEVLDNLRISSPINLLKLTSLETEILTPLASYKY